MRAEKPVVALVDIEQTLVLYKEGNRIQYNYNLIEALLKAGISRIFLITKTTNFFRVESWDILLQTLQMNQHEFIERLKRILGEKGIEVLSVISTADYAWHINKNEAEKFLQEFGDLKLIRFKGEDLQNALKEKIFDCSEKNRYPAIRNFLIHNNSEGQVKPGTVYEGICNGSITGAPDVRTSYNLLGVACSLKEEGSMGVLFAFCAPYLQGLDYQEVIYITASNNNLSAVFSAHNRQKPNFYLSTVFSEKDGESFESYNAKLVAPLLAFQKSRLMIIKEFLESPLNGNNPLRERLSKIKNRIISADLAECIKIERELLQIFSEEKNTDFKSDTRITAIHNSVITHCYNADDKLIQLQKTLNSSPLLSVIKADLAKKIVGEFNPLQDAKTPVSLAGTCRLFRRAAQATCNNWVEVTKMANISKTIKVSLIGDHGSGRVSLRHQFVFGQCPQDLSQLNNEVWLNAYGEKVKFSILLPEKAGNSKLYLNPYRDVNAIIVVFDLCDRPSFNNVRAWLTEIDRYSPENMIKVLVGNKSDWVARRDITSDEAKDFAEPLNIPYIETSAKKGDGVKEAFEAVASEYFRRHPEPPSLVSSRNIDLSSLKGPGK